jgi:monoamine oxidase
VTCDTSMSNFPFRAKKVIVSVLVPLYSHIAFSPHFLAAKSAVATSSFFRYTSKSIVVYDSPCWREHGYSGVCNSDCGPIGFTRDTCIEQDGQFSMVWFMACYAGRELSKCKKEEQRRQVAEQIRTTFGARGGDVPEPRKILLQDWAKDECIWGVPRPVLGLGQLVKGGIEAIKLPFRSLHFVGVETSYVKGIYGGCSAVWQKACG